MTNAPHIPNEKEANEMNKGNVLVREAMKVKPVTVKPKTSVEEVAILMKEKVLGTA